MNPTPSPITDQCPKAGAPVVLWSFHPRIAPFRAVRRPSGLFQLPSGAYVLPSDAAGWSPVCGERP